MPTENTSKCLLCSAPMKCLQTFDQFAKNDQIYKIYICPECRLGMTLPTLDAEQLDRLYSSDTYRDHHSRFIRPVEKVILYFRKSRIRQIEKAAQKGRILDIGCARGVILSAMRENGWETYGLEMNDETASHARNTLGINVKTGSLTDAQFDKEFFNVITIWHVLEHLPDPLLTIKECRRILKPGGLLVLALPNFDSLQSRIAGRHWFHLDMPYHLYHFSLHNLRLLLENHSFMIRKVKHFSFEFNPFGYLQSLLNMCNIRNNLLYDILRAKTIRRSLLADTKHFKFYFDLCLLIILVPIFLPFSLLFSLVEAFAGKGGTIEVYAVKQDRS